MKSRGRPTTLTGVWAERVQAAGSKQALAEALCVNASTVYRYAKGQSGMSGAVETLLKLFDEKHGIKP